MKRLGTLGLVLVGIGAVSCAVVFAQTQETTKQPIFDSNGLFRSDEAHLWGLEVQRQFANIQQQTQALAKQYVKTEKEDQKKEIRKKLGDLLAQQFDTQVQKQQKELADLEKQIAGLKSLLKKRTDAKTTIIERRMDQLIQDAEGLGWNVPNGSNFINFYQQANPTINAFPEAAPKKP